MRIRAEGSANKHLLACEATPTKQVWEPEPSGKPTAEEKQKEHADNNQSGTDIGVEEGVYRMVAIDQVIEGLKIYEYVCSAERKKAHMPRCD